MKWKIALLTATFCQLNAAHATASLTRAACLAKLKTIAMDHGSHLLVPAGASFAAEALRFATQLPVASSTSTGSGNSSVGYPIGESKATSLTNEWDTTSGTDDRSVSVSISQERFASMNYEFDVQETWTHEIAGAEEDESISQQFDVTMNCELQLFQTSIRHRQVKDGVLSQSEQAFAGALPKVTPALMQRSDRLPSDGKFFFSTDELFGSPEFKAQLSPGAPKVYLSFGYAAPFIPIRQIQTTSIQATPPFLKAGLAMKGYVITYLYQGASINSTVVASSDKQFELSRSFSDDWSVPVANWSTIDIVRLDHSGDLQVSLADGLDPDAAIKKVDMITNVPVTYPNLGAYWQVLSAKTNLTRLFARGHSHPTSYDTVLLARDPLIYSDIKGDTPFKPGAKHGYLYASSRAQTSAPEVVRVAADALSKTSDPGDRMALSETIAQVIQNYVSYEYTEVDSGGQVTYQSAQKTLQMGKGICEDFSIVFAAVARHLGIPTRVVSGMSLSTSHVGFHAWVEVEARDGVWIPIDPQNPLDKFDPSAYVPFGMELNDYPNADILPNKLPDKPVTKILETR